MPGISAPRHGTIPIFFLYGEPRREVGARFIHIEPLEDRSEASDWNIRPHAHADLNHVFFINRGKGQMTVDGLKIPFEAPCLLVLPAGRVHGFAYEPGAAGWVLTIAEAYLRELIAREPDFSDIFSHARCLAVEDEAGMEDQLFRLGQELVWNAPGFATAIEGHLLGILVAMLRLSHHATREIRPVTGRAGGLVARFRACVETMYRTSAPLQDYAASLCITQAQLRRACIQITGQAPMRIIQDRIFLEAQRVLLYTNMTVAEAAHYLGFTDNAYFTRLFTKRAGCSPREFRLRGKG